MQLPEEPERLSQINIVPMIDVIFAVLIFFILASLTLTQSEQLPVDLPGAETAEAPTATTLEITLGVDGSVFVGNRPSSLDQVLQDVIAVVPADQAGLVVIRADQQVPHGTVVNVMDQLRQLKGIRLAIATQTQPQPQ